MKPFLYKNKFVSGVFRGEGEEVFPLWLKSMESAKKRMEINHRTLLSG